MPKREVDKIIKELKKKTKTKHRKRKARKVARARPFRKILTEEDLDRRLRDSVHHMSDKDRIDRKYPHSFMKQRVADFSARQQAKMRHRTGVAHKYEQELKKNPAFASPDDLWRQPAMQPNYNLPSAPRVNNDPIIQAAAKAAADAAVRPVLQAIDRQQRGRGRPGDSRRIREGLRPYVRQSRHPEGGFGGELPGGGGWHGGVSDSSEMAEIMRRGAVGDVVHVKLSSSEGESYHQREPRGEWRRDAERVSGGHTQADLKMPGEESRRHTTYRGAPEGHIVATSIARARQALATTTETEEDSD